MPAGGGSREGQVGINVIFGFGFYIALMMICVSDDKRGGKCLPYHTNSVMLLPLPCALLLLYNMHIHQIGDALSDAPEPSMEYAMRQESEQILRVGQRIASCMAKYENNAPCA